MIGVARQPVERNDPWDVRLDALRDGLPVPEVAGVLGRTVDATEAVLVRARGAFRRLYESGEGDA